MGSLDIGNIQLNDTINKMNAMISSANLSCPAGSDCDIKKETATLRDDYLQAEFALTNAPKQFKEAKKNYIVFTDGEDAYNTMNQQEIEAEAEAYVSKKIELFITQFRNAINNNENYSTGVESTKYVNDVLLQIMQNNEQLEKSIDETGNDILTNDRKNYYELENYATLEWWYKVWLYIYIFLLIIFTIAIFVTDSHFSFMSKIGILILFIAYIFITKPIILFTISILRTINSFLPKNVYLSIY